MNARETFTAIRRAYRAACRVSPLADNAIPARIAACSALRAFTGKWDTCEPARFFDWYEPRRNVRVRRPIVTATAYRFFRRGASA